MVKNPPADAGGPGLISGPERSHMLWNNVAHTLQLLSPCSRAQEPQLLSPGASTTEADAPRARAPQQEKQREARGPQREQARLTAAREKPAHQ